jgi:hypothetical protein
MYKETIFQFHGKNVLGSKYVIHWIEVNCPRVVIWMHRNLVHQLTVGFRRLQKKREEKRENETDRERNTSKFFLAACNYFAIKSFCSQIRKYLQWTQISSRNYFHI